MDRSKRLAEENVPRLLFAFSLPAIVGMMAQALYYLVDRIVVGRAIGKLGLAGITIALPFMLLAMALGMLIGLGATALVSIRLGEQKRAEAEQVLGNALMLLVVTSSLLSAVGLFYLDPLLRAFGAQEVFFAYAKDYLQVLMLGTVFQTVGFGLNATIRGEGNPRVAMFTMLIGVLLNAILAPVFIFIFHWGMKGAALATVLSQAVSAAWVVAYFLGGRSLLKIRLRNLPLRWPICLAIMAIGSPPCLMQIAASVLNSILNHQLGDYGGALAISVWGIMWSIMMVFFMPVVGICQGSQPIIGYNFGAERFDRVKQALQTGVLAASAVSLVGFLLAMLSPGLLIRLFDSTDQSQISLGSHAMRIAFFMSPLIGFQIVSASYFQAVGKPVHSMFLSLSRQILILIPMLLILPRFFGLDGVWAAIPTADFSSSLLTGIWLFLELRHLHRRHTDGNGEMLLAAAAENSTV